MAMTAEQNAAINDFWTKNRGNPDQLRSAMEQYGVNVNDLAGATGVGLQDLNNYFTSAGVTDGWQGVTTNKAAYAPAFAGMDPQSSYLNVMGRPSAMSSDPQGRAGNTPAVLPSEPTTVGIGSQVSQYAKPQVQQQQLPQQTGGNLGIGAPAVSTAQTGGNWGSYAYQKNPYLDSMARNITNQVNDNWSRNLAPTIRSGAIQNGSYGGSRQGVVEANALKDVNSGLTNALTNMYGQDYQTSMGRNLQRYQGDQSYDLGLRNNDLGFSNLDFQINQGNVNNQLAGANLGMNTWGTQQQGNQAGITAGSNIQNTPYNNWSNFNSAANNVGQGLASNTTNQDAQGNPILGALGGWQLGSKIAGNLGFGPPVSDGGYSMGLGSAYGGNRQGM